MYGQTGGLRAPEGVASLVYPGRYVPLVAGRSYVPPLQGMATEQVRMPYAPTASRSWVPAPEAPRPVKQSDMSRMRGR